MSRVTATTGLISGLPIASIVDQLVKAQATSYEALNTRTKSIRSQQLAVTEMMAMVLAVQVSAKNLFQTDLFNRRAATSSDAASLLANVTGTPPIGSQQFTVRQTAQAHQVVSKGIASDSEPLGAGAMTIRFGGEVDQSLSLDLLNGGAGVQRGRIRITDRSGASAEVDLRFVQTVDDVLNAINNQTAVNVSAQAVGDRIRLVDGTGQTASNLKVQEVGGGSTAASLGLAGIDVAAGSADGADILRLYEGLALERLNDGAGVDIHEALKDIKVDFRDGSSTFIDLHALDNTSRHANSVTTAANGLTAQVRFTAETSGPDGAGIQVEFVHNAGITAGAETVAYNATSKKLVFQIEAGATTANDIVAALNNDPAARQHVRASLPTGSSGTGLVDVADKAATVLPLTVAKERTLGDVLKTLNSAAPAKLRAELVGDRIVLTDLTADNGGTFQVTSPLGSPAPDQLGLTGTAVDGVITSARLLGGIKSSLLSTLNGGQGAGTLGQISLTDRGGAQAVVDLADAETLDDVIARINAAGLGLRAAVNDARNGIVLRDTTGGGGALVVANADGTNSADKLQLAVDGQVDQIDSGNLRRQSMSLSTKLSTLNGGAGVRAGAIRVTTTDGAGYTVQLPADTIQTVGDVIREINRVVGGAKARINDDGDGILLYDTAGGPGILRVDESGGYTAADLKLLGTGVEIDVDGSPKKAVNGSTTFRIEIGESDTLTDLIRKINELGQGFSASKYHDGSSVAPFRLSILSPRSGEAGRMLIDASGLSLRFQETTRAQDALLVLGSADSGSQPLLASSSNNQFENVIPGLRLQAVKASTAPITVNVNASDTSLAANVQTLVDNYNKLRKKLADVTAFNPETNVRGTLLGDHSALRMDIELSQLLSGRFFGVGSIQSLQAVGVSIQNDGTLAFDSQRLKDAFAADPSAVQGFFATEGRGLGHKLYDLIERMAGEDNSLLQNRLQALNQKVLDNENRLEFLEARLVKFRERTLLQFTNLEMALGKLSTAQSALGALQPLPPMGTG